MKSKAAITLLFVILGVPFVLLSSYNITLAISQTNNEQASVISYVRGSEELDGNFTQRELEHLADVKRVMNFMEMLFSLLAILVIVLAMLLYKKELLGNGLLWSGLTGMTLTLLIILVGVFNFDELFSKFHLLFFKPGSWIFSPEDRLIQLFPLTFFISMTKSILTNAALLNITSIIAGLMIRRYHK